MQSGFSLFVLPFECLSGVGDRRAVLLSRTPAHKFFEKGPWRLRNTTNDVRYEVSYVLPTMIELDGASGTFKEDVSECLQSMLQFPIRIEPEIECENLPTLLTPRDKSEGVTVKGPISCVCSFRNKLSEVSPDIISRKEEFFAVEESLSEMMQDLLRFRREVPKREPMDETLVQSFADAVGAADLKPGMVIPCEIKQEGEVNHVACLLIEELEDNMFRCDLYVEQPVDISEGTELIRRIEGHESRQDLSCNVGVVLSLVSG